MAMQEYQVRAQLRVRKSSYFKDGDFTDGWLIELRVASDPGWTVLSFRDRCGEVLTWYDSEQSAKAKIDEIKDAINAHNDSMPTASHQTAGE